MSSIYSIGAMNQLSDALEKAGYTPDDITKLKQFADLSQFKAVLYGQAQIMLTKHLIDTDADPFLPDGWKVEKHQKAGQLEWNPARVKLYLSKHQKGGKYIGGHDLRKELENQPVMNANVLDYLLAHPDLIPESWKGKVVFFWGTIYRGADDDLYVRFLGWLGSRWDWNYRWLDVGWDDSNPAALLASE